MNVSYHLFYIFKINVHVLVTYLFRNRQTLGYNSKWLSVQTLIIYGIPTLVDNIMFPPKKTKQTKTTHNPQTPYFESKTEQ